MLKLAGRRAVVIGGGAVAARKTRFLLDGGAKVKVVAEAFVAEFVDKKPLAGAELVRRSYESSQLDGASLVIACTSDRDLNARIADDARRAGALVNCVDQPAECDFFVPAIVSDGPVVVGISTGGAAPALCSHLKKTVSSALPHRVGEFAEALSQLRESLQNRVADTAERGGIMKQLSSHDSYEAFLAGGREALAEKFEELTSPHSS